MAWLGLDIGGANIKIADGRGYARATAFPLWKRPHELSAALNTLLTEAPEADSIAITMSGELADCFETKAEGVSAILDAAEQAAAGKHLAVYLCNGQLVAPAAARDEPLLAAASNWHVLASFTGRFSGKAAALLFDLGSTTCDIIPIENSNPATRGLTDPARLASGELVYTGVRRSPVCAVVSELSWGTFSCRVAQELFATTHDAYLLLGDVPEDARNLDTADGRPCTKHHAHSRLARMICADTTIFSLDDAMRAATVIRREQLTLLHSATRQVLSAMTGTPKTLIVSGEGEFLLRRLLDSLQLDCEMVSLQDQLGAQASQAACAHALATLASERADA